MYRITGDKTWQDKGWKMFQSTVEIARTDVAFVEISGMNRSSPEQNTPNLRQFTNTAHCIHRYDPYSREQRVDSNRFYGILLACGDTEVLLFVVQRAGAHITVCPLHGMLCFLRANYILGMNGSSIQRHIHSSEVENRLVARKTYL